MWEEEVFGKEGRFGKLAAGLSSRDLVDTVKVLGMIH